MQSNFFICLIDHWNDAMHESISPIKYQKYVFSSELVEIKKCWFDETPCINSDGRKSSVMNEKEKNVID